MFIREKKEKYVGLSEGHKRKRPPYDTLERTGNDVRILPTDICSQSYGIAVAYLLRF